MNAPSFIGHCNPDGGSVAARSWLGRRLDRVGIVGSALCTLHCAVPLALAGMALVTGTAGEQVHHAHHHGGSLVQLAFAIASVAFAAFLLGRSYLLRHRDWRPLGMFGIAVAALGLGTYIPWHSEAAGMAVTAAGFAALVAAQLVDMALFRGGNACCSGRRCWC